MLIAVIVRVFFLFLAKRNRILESSTIAKQDEWAE